MTRRDAVARLAAAGVSDPAGDARRIFDWAYGAGAATGAPQTRETPNDRTRDLFDRGIAARALRRPVSQIVGRRAFWMHDFHVTPDVLDPRPETETLIAAALEAPFGEVLDLGTGSGAIVLSLLAERPQAHGVATDISTAALEVAALNAARLGVDDRLRLVPADWFDPLPRDDLPAHPAGTGIAGPFDLIVSNPPYIAEAEIAFLAPEVRDWEPRIALTPGGDGLAAYRAIAVGAPARLAAGGRILVEIGPTQGHAVADLFRQAGLEGIRILPDLDGRDRVIAANRSV